MVRPFIYTRKFILSKVCYVRIYNKLCKIFGTLTLVTLQVLF